MIINNNLQAFYKLKKLGNDVELGKLETLIPQFLRSGIEVYSHQVYASTLALSNPFLKGFILADEAGLGKTMEALLILSQYQDLKSKSLVVVPTPTINDWLSNIVRIFDYKCFILDNTERLETNSIRTTLKDYENGIVLTTYDFILQNEDLFKQYDWNLCVLDEAHRFRNYKIKDNKTADTIQSISKNARKILLTATPIQKNEDDIFGLINFIDDNIFTDYDEFHKRYFRKPENYPELREIISPYIFRTLRNQVKIETELPERKILTQIYQMTSDEEKLYYLLEQYISKSQKQAFPEMSPYNLALMLYGTLSSSPYALSKTLSGVYMRLLKNGNNDSLLEAKEINEMLNLSNAIQENNKDKLLLDALKQTFSTFTKKGTNKKCIIFTSNTQTQEHIHKYLLQNTDYNIYSFNGTTNDEPIKKFKQSDDVSVLISTDKGNESLNWQESSFIINYDFPQVLLDMEQRISRAHRIGQTSDVFVINFICPNNFYDVRMYELFYKRTNTANSIIGASDNIISGAIDGNIIENIKDTLSNVRKKKEVQIDMSELSEEFKEELEQTRTHSNEMLFNTFDKSIVEKTKNYGEIIRTKILNMQSTLNEIARFYFKDNFIDDNTFEYKTAWHRKNIYAAPNKYSLVDDKNYYKFTLSSEPCQDMLYGLSSYYNLKPLKLIFDGKGKYSGKKGYLCCFNLNYSYLYGVKAMHFVGIDDLDGEINESICEDILNMECLENSLFDLPNSINNKFESIIEKQTPLLIKPLELEYQNNSQLPINNIKRKANSQKVKLEIEINNLKNEIEKIKKQDYSDNFASGLSKNQKINELSEKYFEMKDNEFLEKSKINKEMKKQINDFLEKYPAKLNKNINFMLYFEVK